MNVLKSKSEKESPVAVLRLADAPVSLKSEVEVFWFADTAGLQLQNVTNKKWLTALFLNGL